MWHRVFFADAEDSSEYPAASDCEFCIHARIPARKVGRIHPPPRMICKHIAITVCILWTEFRYLQKASEVWRREIEYVLASFKCAVRNLMIKSVDTLRDIDSQVKFFFVDTINFARASYIFVIDIL